MWSVSRQHQWSTGNYVVEISAGGIDYMNPDALCQKYPGELKEYHNPEDAVETAIKIAEAWQKDAPEQMILIDHGGTGGYTMPFDGMELNEDTYKILREWAAEQLEKLPKCDGCGELIEGPAYILNDYGDEWKFCREYCAEKWLATNLQEEEN